MSAKKLKEFAPDRGYTKEDWDEVSDNPAWTPDQFAAAKPFAEVFPDLAESIRRTRGKQKAPTKELVSLRIDRATLDAYRATGPGWQARVNDTLRKALKKGAA